LQQSPFSQRSSDWEKLWTHSMLRASQGWQASAPQGPATLRGGHDQDACRLKKSLVVSGCDDFILVDFSCLDPSARAFRIILFNIHGTPRFGASSSARCRRLRGPLFGAPARSEVVRRLAEDRETAITQNIGQTMTQNNSQGNQSGSVSEAA
jgi:hypothetical protein